MYVLLSLVIDIFEPSVAPVNSRIFESESRYLILN